MKAIFAGLQGRRTPVSNTIWTKDAPLAIVSPCFGFFFFNAGTRASSCMHSSLLGHCEFGPLELL